MHELEALWTKNISTKYVSEAGAVIGSSIEALDTRADGYIAGWASTEDVDWHGDIVKHGAFAESIAKKGTFGPKGVKLLIDHDFGKLAGRILTLEYRPEGLWIEAQLNLEIQYVRDVYSAAKANGGLSFSVGFMRGAGRGDVTWEDINGLELRVIHKAALFEVSVVASPSNESATMDFIKSAALQGLDLGIKPTWKVSAATNLPTSSKASWDEKAAKDRIFETAGIGEDDPDLLLLKRAFLVHDASKPHTKSAYQVPFADVVNGRLRTSPLGLKAAGKSLKALDLPESVKVRAQNVIDAYQDRMDNAVKELTLLSLKAMLVDEGWVKDEETVEGLTTIVKANLHLFHEQRPEEKAESEAAIEAKALNAITRIKSLLETKEAG